MWLSSQFEKNKDLTPFTTFRIPVRAALFAEYSSVKQLVDILQTEEYINNEVFHIGGGSNLLFDGDFNGLVLHSAIRGITRYDKDESTSFVIAGAGEVWNDLVKWCVENGLAGLENLSGIPGEVGAAPVQNVGAFGVEAADVIHNVECYDLQNNKTVILTNAECKFGYRDSIFKNEAKNRYIILRVSFKLKISDIANRLEYGPLKDLKEKSGGEPRIREVTEEIIRIRREKLPDPEILGSAGSYFKNPVVHEFFYREIMGAISSEVPFYPTDRPDFVKLSAGWLIEHAGLKGYSVGGAAIYEKQCLVIVNRGNATAQDVIDLSKIIIDKVREKFGVILYPEVNVITTAFKVTILGSGTSKGIPEIGCRCKVCLSESEFDKRLRCSALIETASLRLLIDPSPDFRQQALRLDLYDLDAALITHSHYDHVGGIDDLRPYCGKGKFPLFMKEDVKNDITKRVDYCFREKLYPGVPTFEIHLIDEEPFIFKGLKITPIKVMHGKLPILGYRIGRFAYITDAKTIPDYEMGKLENLEVLVVNALRYRDHFAHFTLQEALDLIEKLKPGRAYLTHFNHEIGFHADLEKKLPANVFPCYDGLVIHIK